MTLNEKERAIDLSCRGFKPVAISEMMGLPLKDVQTVVNRYQIKTHGERHRFFAELIEAGYIWKENDHWKWQWVRKERKIRVH